MISRSFKVEDDNYQLRCSLVIGAHCHVQREKQHVLDVIDELGGDRVCINLGF